MVVGALLLRLHLPNSHSLKEKRQVVKSLTARLASQFGVSVAEVGELNTRQAAEMGIVYVSNEARHVERVLDTVVHYVEDARPDTDVFEIGREMMTLFNSD